MTAFPLHSMKKVYTSEFLNRNYTSFLRGLCMIAIVFAHTANEFPALLAQYHISGLLIGGKPASSAQTGFLVYVAGDIVITILLTYAGKKTETLVFHGASTT